MTNSRIRAVFFDFGGVVLTSPFEAFERYERANDLPVGFIRSVNTTDPDTNAWARLERNEVDVGGFIPLFEAEARSQGHEVDGRAIIAMLAGTVRPAMVAAIDAINTAGLTTACLTNNFSSSGSGDSNRTDSDGADSDGMDPDGMDSDGTDGRSASEKAAVADALQRFDFIVESSQVGIRKPEPDFYRHALSLAGVAAAEVVFLDDLGINLKPARAMGMTTIKVVNPNEAISELEALLGFDLG